MVCVLVWGYSVYAWALLAPTGLDGVQQVLSTWVFLTIAASACLAGFLNSRALRQWTILITAVGIGIGAFNGLLDTTIAQIRRDNSQASADMSRQIEGPALIHLFLSRSAMLAPDQYTLINRPSLDEDFALIDAALDQGLRVIMPVFTAEEMVALRPEYSFEMSEDTAPDLVEIIRSGAR